MLPALEECFPWLAILHQPGAVGEPRLHAHRLVQQVILWITIRPSGYDFLAALDCCRAWAIIVFRANATRSAVTSVLISRTLNCGCLTPFSHTSRPQRLARSLSKRDAGFRCKKFDSTDESVVVVLLDEVEDIVGLAITTSAEFAPEPFPIVDGEGLVVFDDILGSPPDQLETRTDDFADL